MIIEITEIYRRKIKQKISFLVVFTLLLVFSIFVGVCIGAVDIPFPIILEILFKHQCQNNVYTIIIWEIRLPRVLIAVLVGSSLAVAGCIVQSIFRNPLASPYVLGISSGAAFGAAICVALDLWLIIPIPIFAFAFAIIALTITYIVARENGELPITSLLLAGIAVASLFSALTSFMMYLAGEKLEVIVFWLMGGLYGLSWNEFRIIGFGCIPLLILSFFFGKELNIMMLGDDVAKSMGVDVNRIRQISIVLVSLLVAVCVAYTGPIGFIGLIVPHMVRLMIGSDNRFLIPASALFGGSFLVLADLLARTLIRPAEIPIGVITSLFGVPFFIYLLKRRRRMMSHAT